MRHRFRTVLALVLAAGSPAATAWAGGAGAGIAQTGGAGSGASSADARGLALNPAGAVGGNGTDLHVDVGLMILDTQYRRASETDPDRTFGTSHTSGISPVPYVAIRSDALFGAGRTRPGRFRGTGRSSTSDPSRFGLGLSVSAPFGRSATYDEEHAGRYHLVSVAYSTVFVSPALAFRPLPALRLGLGPILGFTRFSVTQRVDLAPSLQILSPGDPPYPPESPLLEGRVAVRNATGFSPHLSLGALYDFGEFATLGASFVSGSEVTVRGRSKVTPSLDFNVYSEGDFTLTYDIPPMVNLGARIRPNERIGFSLETQWVGWSVVDHYDIRISNSRLASSNEDTQSLLDFLEINEGQLVGSILDKEQVAARGWRDSWNATLGAEYSAAPLEYRFELGYDRSAIPDGSVTPGNQDFTNLIFGFSTRWSPPNSRLSAGASITHFYSADRHIKNSRYDTYAPQQSGYAYPSGNGTYSATLTRLAINTSFRF